MKATCGYPGMLLGLEKTNKLTIKLKIGMHNIKEEGEMFYLHFADSYLVHQIINNY